MRRFTGVLLFCVIALPLWAEPYLETSRYRTGDIVGRSTRRDERSFVVQSLSKSPINHAGAIEVRDGKVLVWHLEGKDFVPTDLEEFFDPTETFRQQVFYIHARPDGLTAEKAQALVQKLDTLGPEDPGARVCSDVLHHAYDSVGIAVGERLPLPEPGPELDFLRRHISVYIKSRKPSVLPVSLFEKGVTILDRNLPLHWTREEMFEAWRRTGEANRLAHLYFGKPSTTRRLIAALEREGKKGRLRCSLETLRRLFLREASD